MPGYRYRTASEGEGRQVLRKQNNARKGVSARRKQTQARRYPQACENRHKHSSRTPAFERSKAKRNRAFVPQRQAQAIRRKPSHNGLYREVAGNPARRPPKGFFLPAGRERGFCKAQVCPRVAKRPAKGFFKAESEAVGGKRKCRSPEPL